jgi:hypothetical protein
MRFSSAASSDLLCDDYITGRGERETQWVRIGMFLLTIAATCLTMAFTLQGDRGIHLDENNDQR